MIIIKLPVVSTPVAGPGISKGSDGALTTSSEDGSQYDSSMMTYSSKRTPEGFHSTPMHNHSGLEPLFREIQERREECDHLRQEIENVKVYK